MVSISCILSLVVAATLSLAARTGDLVMETFGDAVMLAGKRVVDPGVGATKLGCRGAPGIYRAVRDARNPERGPFPPATFLCSVGAGVFVAAERGPDGKFTCDGV